MTSQCTREHSGDIIAIQGLPFEAIDNRSLKHPPGDRIFDRLLTGASPREIELQQTVTLTATHMHCDTN